MDAFNLSNVVPQCVIDYVTDYEPANVSIVRDGAVVATWRDTRSEEWNTQNVYLFGTASISDSVAVGALHLPNWSVDRSPFALCLIVDNEIVEVRGVAKDAVLVEINFHEVPIAMAARFSQECIVQPRGKLSKFRPVVEWFTHSHFALVALPVTYYGPTAPEPEHEGIPAEYVEDVPKKKFNLSRLLGDDDSEPDDPDYEEDEDPAPRAPSGNHMLNYDKE